jgi:transposase
MGQMSAFVGIDVSKATLDIAILSSTDPVHQHLPNTPQGFERLNECLQNYQPISRVGLEASGRYGEALAHFLATHGYPVSYLNPKQIHAFGKVYLHYNKTDQQDAQLIARFCQLHCPDLWRPTNPLQMQLQQRSRRLNTLEKMRQQERNRLQSGITDPFVLDQIRDTLSYYDTLIEQTQIAIDQLIQQTSSLRHQHRLLVSITGIGTKTAALLLAELGDLERFSSARQLAAYIGITPQHFTSGTSVNKRSSISKQGNARVRAALYMPAIVAKRWNKPCQHFAQRLEEAHKPGKVIIIAVMRKLVHQIFAILKSGQPFDPDFGLSS